MRIPTLNDLFMRAHRKGMEAIKRIPEIIADMKERIIKLKARNRPAEAAIIAHYEGMIAEREAKFHAKLNELRTKKERILIWLNSLREKRVA